jgi:uncharacterized cupredoxin-like copper-binding protein
MTSNRSLFAGTLMIALVGSLLLTTPQIACAHGDESHAAGPVKKEQTAWGIAGDAKSAKRTITLTMSDAMRFKRDRIAVGQGETVRIVVRNDGKQLHEFVLGTKQEPEEHAALMLKFPGMEHDEPYMAHVPAGKTGEIVWTFNRAGEFDFACLIPGHYQAGMFGKVSVASKSTTTTERK